MGGGGGGAVALAAVCSKEVVLLLPHCLWGDLCLMLVFISITLCHPSFVISLMGERKLVALL